MLDQANHLRKLVLAGGRGRAEHPGESPRMIAVGGGKGGIGTTTIAVNLAIALARDGRRVLLVDADLEGADVATLCGVDDRETLADVLASRRSLHEVIQRGPAGIQVVAGAWARGPVNDTSPVVLERLLRDLTQLGPFADYIVLDVGNSLNRVAQRFWQAASQVLLVTTPEPVAVMDAYAAVKVHLSAGELPAVYSLVNMTPVGSDVAIDVHQRIERACRRFLGIGVQMGGEVSADALVAGAAAEGHPVLVDYPNGSVAAQLERVASLLASAPLVRQSLHDESHAVVA